MFITFGPIVAAAVGVTAGTISNLIESPVRRQRRYDQFMQQLERFFFRAELPIQRRVAVGGGMIELGYDQSSPAFTLTITRTLPSGATKTLLLEHLGQIGSVTAAAGRFCETWRQWGNADRAHVQQLWDRANAPTLRLRRPLRERLVMVGR